MLLNLSSQPLQILSIDSGCHLRNFRYNELLYLKMTMAAIEIANIKKTYTPKKKKQTVKALKGISFSIEEGELFGLLGPNGAGKTTLINILAGVIQKTSGTAELNGLDLDKDPIRAKFEIGVVPQEVSFDAFFTLEDALRFQFGYYGQPVDEKHLDKIFKDLSLEDKRKMKPRALSGGMKRRFMIARALVHRPKILVLDEPTAGVDVDLRHDLYELIRFLNDQGTTIILTSHYLEEVELLCERIAILDKGKLVALDHKNDLKDRFQSTRQMKIALSSPVEKLPGSLNKFDPKQLDSELTLTFEENDYKKVLKAVADADLPVANFQVIEPSLEDVFVSLTNNHDHK